MGLLLDDFRYGVRRVLRQPGASAAVAALLALAIGVSSAMFAVVDAYIVRPAPFRDAAALSQVAVQKRDSTGFYHSFATARLWRQSGVFEHVSGIISAGGTLLTNSGDAVSVNTTFVTPGTFEMAGVAPLLGRSFAAGEGRLGGADSVVLSEPLWRDRFGADPRVIGSTIQISDAKVTVVGVMPASFRFPYRGDGIWRPIDLDQPPADLAKRSLAIFVRRPAGVPAPETARLALEALGPSAVANSRVELYSVERGLLDRYSRDAIVALAMVVGLVFVVLCANVTNLILSRMMTRAQEFGVAAAIGASRRRLVRQVLFEYVAIGICAGTAGLAIAYGIVGGLNRILPADFLRRTLNPLDLDVRAVLATWAVGAVATALAGLPAAFLGTRANPVDSLRLGSRTATELWTSRALTRVLLTIEVAMAVALLATGGLQMRSFMRLTTADRGVDSERVLSAQVTLPASQFGDRAARAAVALALAERIRAVPGVADTALAAALPPAGGDLYSGAARADLPGAAPLQMLASNYRVAPDFFRTLGIPITAGRGVAREDGPTDVVLGDAMKRSLFGATDAVGHSFTFGDLTYRVIGLAAEIRNPTTDPRADLPEFYSTLFVPGKPGEASAVPGSRTVTLAIRCGDPCASIPMIREAIHIVSAHAGVASIRPLSDDFLEQLTRPRLAATTALVFAFLGLFASAVGIYGVFHYSVSRQKRELGVRAALGATPGALGRSVVAGSLKITIAGAAGGAFAAWLLAKWLAAPLYGVQFADPTTWAVVLATVAVTAPLASWRPARQAMRVDPSFLLRNPD
jgi:predicted permease